MNGRITYKLFGQQIVVSPSPSVVVDDLPPAIPEVDTSLRLWCFDAPKQVVEPKPDAPVLGKEIDSTSLDLGISIDDPKPDAPVLAKEIDSTYLDLGIGIGPSWRRKNNRTPYVCMDHAWLLGKDHGSTSNNNPVTTADADADADVSTRGGKKKTSSRKRKEKNRKPSAPRRPIKRRKGDEGIPEPRAPGPELAAKIGPGIEPVFLYRKRLEMFDTLRSQNRLGFSKKEKLKKFLTEEESVAVFDPEKKLGVEVIAIGRTGTEFPMRCKTWGKVTVLMQKWWKLLIENEGAAHQWVHLWGYRKDDGKFRLAVEFHKDKEL